MVFLKYSLKFACQGVKLGISKRSFVFVINISFEHDIDILYVYDYYLNFFYQKKAEFNVDMYILYDQGP